MTVTETMNSCANGEGRYPRSPLGGHSWFDGVYLIPEHAVMLQYPPWDADTIKDYIRKGRVALNLEWTPYLAVGVSAIDNQHKELFSRFNNLMDAMMLGNGKEELTNTLVFLEDYVVTHFGTEEKLMDEYFYAAAPGHKAQHATFAQDFAALKKRLEASGANAQLAIETLRRLGDWLMNHVGREDKQLGPFLNAAMIARKAA